MRTTFPSVSRVHLWPIIWILQQSTSIPKLLEVWRSITIPKCFLKKRRHGLKGKQRLLDCGAGLRKVSIEMGCFCWDLKDVLQLFEIKGREIFLGKTAYVNDLRWERAVAREALGPQPGIKCDSAVGEPVGTGVHQRMKNSLPSVKKHRPLFQSMDFHKAR